MRQALQELRDKCAGRVVHIVAGGPSVKEQNVSLLENKITIAINNSFEILPNATALFWADPDWAGIHFDKLSKHRCKLRFSSRMHANLTGYGLGGCTMLKRTGDFDIDHNPDNIRGNNGGAQALNLAVNMGARKIVLLGYDMNMREGTHWHQGHGLAMRPSIYTDLFIPSIESMAASIKQLGIEVINCAPRSALKCFPFQNFESIINKQK